jgi:hypothetical protein
MWLRGTNFCINCTRSPCFAPSFMHLRHNLKCTQTLWNTPNMSLGSNRVDQVHSLRKITKWLRGTNFCINWTSSLCFATSFMQLRNNPKYYETHRNISLGSNGVDWIHSLRKIPTWLLGTKFCINCTSSPYFALSFMQLRNDPKCSKTLWNTPKLEFRVQ